MDNLIRTAPPSSEANNTDVFMWAVHLLGGAEKQVDVEDIYFKAFELAPNRLGWRTRPNVPNFKKTAKALQEIEAKSHVGLLQKLGPNNRRLTPQGVAWITKYKHILEKVYASAATIPAARSSNIEVKRREIIASPVWAMFQQGKAIGITELAYILNCSPAAPSSVWLDRLADLDLVANGSGSSDLQNFTKLARDVYQEGK